MPNFNSFTEACDFFGVDSARALEAAMVERWVMNREAMMDDMEITGTVVGWEPLPVLDMDDEIVW